MSEHSDNSVPVDLLTPTSNFFIQIPSFKNATGILAASRRRHISDGGLTPATETGLSLTACRGGSHPHLRCKRKSIYFSAPSMALDAGINTGIPVSSDSAAAMAMAAESRAPLIPYIPVLPSKTYSAKASMMASSPPP